MNEVGNRPTPQRGASNDPDEPGLVEQAVLEYLEQNPDLLARNPDLLTRLAIPHGETAGAASLLEYQVDVLRDKNRELTKRLRELVAIAGENQQLMERVHKLVLALMACESRDALMANLRQHIKDDFRADRVSVCLFDAKRRDDSIEGLRFTSRDDTSMQAFADFLENLEPLCGRLKPDKMEFLYGSHADEIRSSVLLPLDRKGEIGLLAIGSADESRFYPGMGTEFLRLIGEVLGRHLPKVPASQRLRA